MASFVRGRGVALRLAICVAAGCVAAFVFGGGGAARGSDTGRSARAITAASRPSAFLNGVSCSSPRACTAVGIFEPEGSQGSQLAVAERWNGRRWSSQRVPDQATGVSCPSQRDCVGVGDVTDGLAERWTGATWAVQRKPSVNDESLTQVSCSLPSACTAVGQSRGERALIEHWNGRAWSRQRSAGEPSGAGLDEVSCPSRRVCFAMGLTQASSPFAERWNGSRWSGQRVRDPNPLANAIVFVSGLSCSSARACLAVGSWFTVCDSCNSGGEVFWRWDGSGWTVSARRSPDVYYGVSCVSAAWCVAVSGRHMRLWDGVGWSNQRTRGRPFATFGLGVGYGPVISCASKKACVAVGFRRVGRDYKPLAYRWNGRWWSDVSPSLLSSPPPKG